MSRTVAFGRDILNAPDVDIEDLLACLSATEVQQMLDELASDPDDKHVPASVRNAYKCDKQPTGRLRLVFTVLSVHLTPQSPKDVLKVV